MTTTTYNVPDSPADPEVAALELIVRLPEEILHTTDACDVLQEFPALLQAECCFAGLQWPDAKNIAAAVAFDALSRDDAADFVRFRARNTLGVRDGMEWDDRDGAARALNIAATVLGL